MDRESIAVVGAGAAGLTAAYLLQAEYDVTLFEKRTRLGGHAHTVTVPDAPGPAGQASLHAPLLAPLPIDTGFIVLNDRNYPRFTRLLDDLGVEVIKAEMSFSFMCRETGFQYNGSDLNRLFSQRTNLLRPSFYRFLRDILRFNKQAKLDLEADTVGDIRLGDYLAGFGFKSRMVEDYILPMGAAIWSTSLTGMLDFPAAGFLRFFDNHGLLDTRNRPQWYTIRGGSQKYVQAIAERFQGRVELNADIAWIARHESAVELQMEDGQAHRFDHVVIATHADQALKLLRDPSPEEQNLLGAWEYSVNKTVLHTDASRMPSLKRSWACWNVMRPTRTACSDAAPVHLTYSMNLLQSLPSQQEYFVTLNDPAPMDPSHVIRELSYLHPLFTRASMATQASLPSLNGCRNTYFCGSYFSWGFHEDAIKSGENVAKAFGLSLDGPVGDEAHVAPASIPSASSLTP